jgi:hypothetical protein
VTEQIISVTCDVVACHRSAAGRYLHVRQEGAVEFRVCTGHFRRIEAGEVPGVVAERFDLAELDGRLVLLMDPV